MGRIIGFLFGLVAYAIFLGTFLYAIGFVSGLAVPKTIDSGPDAPLPQALIINLLLMSLFAVQPSVMARPPFKRWWTRFVPVSIERSTYVLLASLVLILLFWLWRPIPQIVWQITDPQIAMAVMALSFAGWLLVLVSTFLINRFRAVRAAPSRDQPRGTNDARAPLQDAGALQGGAAPDLSRLHRRVLGGSRHDGRASLVRGCDDRVHLRRDLSGGARPHPTVRRGVQALPRSGRDAHSVPAQVVLKGRGRSLLDGAGECFAGAVALTCRRDVSWQWHWCKKSPIGSRAAIPTRSRPLLAPWRRNSATGSSPRRRCASSMPTPRPGSPTSRRTRWFSRRRPATCRTSCASARSCASRSFPSAQARRSKATSMRRMAACRSIFAT